MLSLRTMWYDKIICYEPYETGDIPRHRIPLLDPNDPYRCPHCGSNHASIMRQGNDIYCFSCGWRDAEYYNEKLNNLIKWLERREAVFGAPILLSDSEANIAKQKLWRDSSRKHSEHRNAYQHTYYQVNKERIKARCSKHYRDNTEAILDQQRDKRAVRKLNMALAN